MAEAEETILGQTPVPPEWRHSLVCHIEYLWELQDLEWESIDLAAIKYLYNQRAKWNVADPEFIREVHREMFSRVWRWAGDYRGFDTSIGMSHVQLASEVHKVCEDLRYWMKKNIYGPIEMAVRFHHRLVSIHPFTNGNGRHARLMADILMRQFNLEPLNWGGKLLSQNNDIRREYIAAVKAADRRDLEPLLAFVMSNRDVSFV